MKKKIKILRNQNQEKQIMIKVEERNNNLIQKTSQNKTKCNPVKHIRIFQLILYR